MLRYSFLFLFFITSLSYGQREAATWYFGTRVGLDFNSGDPVPLLDGEIDSLEGCETLSDEDGNLLFYTDGVTVWNRNHQIMPNGEGLLGHISSTQSAMAVPRPGSNSIYYIFTSDNVLSYQLDGMGDGFNYSVVNMNLNGGLGDVTDKNISLLPNGSEKLTAVASEDGDNFWIVTHYRDKFYAYNVTSAGVNTTPVVSTSGPNINTFNNFRGAMKISPRGDKLAIAHTLFEPGFGGELILHDFDNETGVVSNAVTLSDNRVFYGVEFSSDSSKLYASGKMLEPGNTTGDLEIIQYDLDASDIIGSRFSVALLDNTFPSDLGGALQIAINGKIYYSIPGISLSVINTPDYAGLNSDFRAFEVSLAGRSSKFGLPPFIQSFFESIVTVENFCLGDATQFTTDTSDPITSIEWDFGDPASGANNTSMALNPTHVFTSTGTFTVTIDVEFADRAPKRFIEFVEISETPVVNQNVELVQCDIDGVNDGITSFNLNQALGSLLPNPLGFTANFFDNPTDAMNNENALEEIGYVNQFDGQVIYVRVFKNALCFVIAELTLRVEPMAHAGTVTLSVCNLNDDILNISVELADLEALLLETYPGTDITFFETEEDALLETNILVDIYEQGPFTTPELYYRVEVDNACATIGHILLDIRGRPVVMDQTIIICPGEESVLLAAEPGFISYEWSTGETTDSITVDGPGVYTVIVFNGADCDATMTFTVENVASPAFVEIEVTDFNNNNSIVVQVDNPDGCLFSINNGGTLQESPIFDGLSIGPYTVQIWKDGCVVYEENVLIGGPPEFFTPNGDGFHDTWHIVKREEFIFAKIYIFDRFGKLLKQLSPTASGWDGTYNGNPLPSSDYWYRIELGDGRLVTGNFTLKR